MDLNQFKDQFKNMNKDTLLIIVALLAILITGGLIFLNNQSINLVSQINRFLKLGPSPEEIAKKAVDYINKENLAGSPASLVSAAEESGVIKIKIKINNNEFDSYATKDGKLLFPYGIEMKSSEATSSSTPAEEKKQKAEIQKRDNPELEAYVVSMCPFGIQMQRVLAKLVKDVPETKSYIKVRYMGSVTSDGTKITAMHGEEEAKENLRQICIREEQPNKYWDYISCYIKEGKAENCEKSIGIDSAKLNGCLSTSERGIAYAKKDFELNDKYNVTGSPTLILNEVEVSEYDYGGRTEEALKSVLCAGFTTEPQFCSKKLDTAQAAAGFSVNYTKENPSNSSANSNNTGASCGQ